VGWVGQYVIPSRPDLGWGECLVMDASETGLGLMLFGAWPDDAEAELEMLVRLEPGRDADPMELHGTVRNSTPVNVGDFRIGIEFASREGTELVAILGAFSPKADAAA
jgi:hypothetical protein